MWVIQRGNKVINVDSDDNLNSHIATGWEIVSDVAIEAAGMRGYENIISPANTVVNADGSLTFTPPAPPSETELYESLRLEAERLLAATDQYGMDDYPDNERRAAYRAYRAELRALNRQEGAPWDGGGPATPWPTKPEV
ncbi:phage tail assembly chaperone [Desulfovibrio intestinalis]|uniref:Phage tail assembly chaperone-like domain-containing protein n=1 Tax=Desulfovibrio intestinalis TaxID=58621 RepID=A0A7W8C319_9BACT|nr:phage tail assembly chaperone [Desulfovibrio intestinalis]MBB5143953.1 hypothetical protein [Desulfovibrio intestinalis]